MNKTIEINCPRMTYRCIELDGCITSEGEEDCEGQVSTLMEWEPGDPNYGADADGNRGVCVQGYWTADPAATCSEGHVLSKSETAAVVKEAEDYESSKGDPEDEYYGPDADDCDD